MLFETLETYIVRSGRCAAIGSQIVRLRSVQGDAQNRPRESDTPMHISAAIAKLDRRRHVGWLNHEPAGLSDPHHHCAIAIEQQDRPIEQLVLAGESDGEFAALICRDAQATAQHVVGPEGDVFYSPRMLQPMQRLTNSGIGDATDYPLIRSTLSYLP
jgi:hypothetical protein